MQEQVQSPQAPEAQPSEPAQGARDGVGRPKEAAFHATAAGNAALEAKRQEIIAAARAKMQAEFRAAQPAPVASALTNAPEPLASTLTPAPAAAPVAPSPGLAEAFTAQLNQQFQEAQRIRTEAEATRAQADARAKAAEDKLERFLANPAMYLQDQGKTLDEWQARLMNGGEPTEFEKLEAKLRKEMEAKLAPAQAELQNLKAVQTQELENRALTEARSTIPAQFPLINHFVGPEQALKLLRQEAIAAAKQGKQLDAASYFQAMEAFYEKGAKAALQDKSAATRLGLSVAPSPSVPVAVPNPSTLSNRVTSTVPSSPPRPRDERERIARGRETIRQLLAEGRL